MGKKENAGHLVIGNITNPLSIKDIVDVARSFRRVEIDEKARSRVQLCRNILNTLINKNVKIYGANTGFGSSRDRLLSKEECVALSTNLIKSHSCSVGNPFPEDVVRAAMLIRANALAKGNSGIDLKVITTLVEMLNNRVYPYVPEKGSVGSSGDLSPLSHLFLVPIGDVDALVHMGTHQHEKYIAKPREEDFKTLSEVYGDESQWPFKRITLGAKDGLASNNGAVFSACITVLGIYDAQNLLDCSDLFTALSYEAIQAVPDCLDDGVVRCRPYEGHKQSTLNIKSYLEGSDLVPYFGASGFNMAHFNRAYVDLRKLVDKTSEIQEYYKKALNDLLGKMTDLQDSIWEGIRALRIKRENEIKQCPKEQELIVCEELFGEIRKSWEELAGWNENDKLYPSSIKKELGRIYFSHTDKVVRSSSGPDVQDNYSFRAASTVNGTARDAVLHAVEMLEIEINSATDNPLILLDNVIAKFWGTPLENSKNERLPEENEFKNWVEENWIFVSNQVKSAANFHGEPVGIIADNLSAAMAEIGNISERRTATLIDENHSKGLPSYLVWNPGLNNGFMIPQYTAASLVSENKILAVPATTDSIPTAENSEDHVSMSTTAARKFASILDNLTYILSIEMLAAYQGIQFRKPAKLGKYTSALEELISQELGGLFFRLGGFENLIQMQDEFAKFGLTKTTINSIKPCIGNDVTFYPLIHSAAKLIREGKVNKIIEPY